MILVVEVERAEKKDLVDKYKAALRSWNNGTKEVKTSHVERPRVKWIVMKRHHRDASFLIQWKQVQLL